LPDLTWTRWLNPETAPGTGTLTPATDDTDFVDIDSLGKLDLPSLPILKQEKDWKQWWNNVIAYFEALELEKFVTEDIPEPQGPEKKRKWNGWNVAAS
jgi:hypothetical protein